VPPIPGVDLKNVFTVREFEDAEALREAAKNNKKVVIAGASFIGLESASSIKSVVKDLDITVCDIAKTPYERVLGAEIGSAV